MKNTKCVIWSSLVVFALLSTFYIFSDIQTYVTELSRQPTQRGYLTEEEALQDGPLTDVRQGAFLKYSSISLADGRFVYNVGETIVVTIILNDGYGKRRNRGGDLFEVRILNSELQAFAPGHVIDHDNGVYTAVVDALWPGKHTITVSLAFRREFIRAIYTAHSQHKAGRTILALFDSGIAKEEMACHPKPEGLAKYKYPELCNLTMDNGGMSWYCGKPSDTRLLCEDWTEIRDATNNETIFSDIEMKLKRLGGQAFPNLTVIVKGDMHRKEQPLCSTVPKRLTWTQDNLSGFFFENTWHPQHCRIQKSIDFKKCLRDKKLTIFGDSTTRQWYKYIMNHLACSSITEKWWKEKWHKRAACVIKNLNFTLEWVPHAQPFHVGQEWDTRRYTTHSITNYLDAFPDNAQEIIVIHMFSHLNGYHQNVFRDRMKRISSSVKRLLQRNRVAQILIKGPHTYSQTGSFSSYVFRDIIKEELKELYDSVVYMEQAGMTVAKANTDIHPPANIVEAAVNQMFSYFCS